MGKEVIGPKKPVIFREGEYTAQDIDTFVTQNNVWRTSDLYDGQLGELFEIQNPDKLRSPDLQSLQQTFAKKHNQPGRGDYIYFPWNGELVHSLKESDYFALRTNRNRDLITIEEQQKLYDTSVVVAGMSVGNIIATTLAYSGCCGRLTIADFDTLETANLNRLRARLADIGTPKAHLAAQQIYDINPYAQLAVLDKGITDENLNMSDLQSPTVIFDEIDDFAMKVKLRRFGQLNGVAVAMMTSLGDTVLVDVERYDTEPDTKPFGGIVPEDMLDDIAGDKISSQEIASLAIKLVGQEYIPTRALASLPKMGTELVGRPQLASTILMDGGLATVLVKSIVLGQPLKSGRYYFDAQALLELPLSTQLDDERAGILQMIKEKMNER